MLLLRGFMIFLCARLMDTTNLVNGVDGGNVTLDVHEKNIDDITWTHGHNRIASSGPSKPINVTSTYRGKLASDLNGSLIIINLHQEDQGMYSASIRLINGEMRTAQYQLQVYKKLTVEDIKIEHTVTSHEPCHLILNCTANGFDVIFFWNSSDLNVTNNVVNVTDPGPETSYTCTAQNPISRSSKSITPWEFCKKENGSSITVSVIIGIFAIGVFAVFTYLYCKWKKRTETHR